MLADVRRGRWEAADPRPTTDEPVEEPTFHEFASEWFADWQRGMLESTEEAVEWRLSYVLLPFFAEHRLTEITAREIDRYREQQPARARSAEDAAGVG